MLLFQGSATFVWGQISAVLTLTGAGGVMHYGLIALVWAICIPGLGGRSGDVLYGWLAPCMDPHNTVYSQQCQAMCFFCTVISPCFMFSYEGLRFLLGGGGLGLRRFSLVGVWMNMSKCWVGGVKAGVKVGQICVLDCF